MAESSSSKAQYPCPSCVGTMPPGVGTMSLQKMLEKGSGKVYVPYSGAAGLSGATIEGTWHNCPRCAGTGLVDDRRRANAPADRRGLWS